MSNMCREKERAALPLPPSLCLPTKTFHISSHGKRGKEEEEEEDGGRKEGRKERGKQGKAHFLHALS